MSCQCSVLKISHTVQKNIHNRTNHWPTIMKYLAVALLLCSLVDLLHGACYQLAALKPGETECVDLVDRTRHAPGSSWTNSACQDCTCSGCCDAFQRPTSIPEDCMMEFDKELCEYKVFKKTDTTKPCKVFGAVGK